MEFRISTPEYFVYILPDQKAEKHLYKGLEDVIKHDINYDY